MVLVRRVAESRVFETRACTKISGDRKTVNAENIDAKVIATILRRFFDFSKIRPVTDIGIAFNENGLFPRKK